MSAPLRLISVNVDDNDQVVALVQVGKSQVLRPMHISLGDVARILTVTASAIKRAGA